MNNCPKCNAEVQATDKFCMNCGSPIEPKSKETNVIENDAKSGQALFDKQPIILAVLVVAILGIIGYLSVKNQSDVINIEDYIISDDEVLYSGVNGNAYLITEIPNFLHADWLYSDLAGLERNAPSQSVDSFYQHIADNCDVELIGLEEPLSNGDSFKVRWLPDYNAINDYQDFEKKVAGAKSFEYEFTVVGLGEVESVDPFSVIEEVSCLDSANNTTFIVSYNTLGLSNNNYEFRPEEGKWEDWKLYDLSTEEWISSFHISAGSYSTLHPGDSLTLELDCSEDFFGDYGFNFTRTKAVYSVKALTYVTSKDAFHFWDWERFKTKLDPYLNDTDQPVALYFENSKNPTASIKNGLEVVIKQSDSYQCYYIDNILQRENGDINWMSSSDSQPVKPGRWFQKESEYKEYFSDHEGDTVIAYDISDLLK